MVYNFQHIRWEDRFLGDTGEVCLVTVDGTTFRIWEPRPFKKEHNKIWFDQKTKKAGVCYEIAISIKTGRIVWFNGPYPAGWGPDLNIFNHKLIKLLLPFEKIMADRNYRDSASAYTKKHVTKYVCRETYTLKPEYMAISHALSRHETINGRMKNWGCLDQVYRHDRSKHHILFSAILVMTQMEILSPGPFPFESGNNYDHKHGIFKND